MASIAAAGSQEVGVERFQAVKDGLLERRRGLLRRVTAVQHDLRRRHDDDSAERASELENDEVLEQLDEDTSREIADIDAALARIREGSYGRCTACGEEISAQRLEVLPFARTCIDCARVSEEPS